MAQGSDKDKQGQLKVELDLDDAPFLEDEPEEEAEKVEEAPSARKEPASAAPELPAGPAPKKFAGKKKKLIIAGAGGLLIIILAVAVTIFFFGGKEEPPPPPPAPEPKEEAPKTPAPPPVQEYVMQWEPFWVELKDTEGASRFLTLKFSIPTTNPVVFAEMNGKKLLLRDALFYYLRNQPIISLRDEAKAAALKSDLLTVINEHLASGKISDILIQEYLLQ